MDGFYSFLALDDAESLASDEGFDVFSEQVDELISSWLRKYINIRSPGYTFEEVVKSIDEINVSDESIRFQILNPRTWEYERMGFWVDILEYIQRETKDLLNRTLCAHDYIYFSIAPETLSIIQSWYPYIVLENILKVDLLYEAHYKSQAGLTNFPIIKICYFAENGEVKQRMIPSIHRWEFTGSVRGAMHVIGMEQGRIIRLLTQKNNLD